MAHYECYPDLPPIILILLPVCTLLWFRDLLTGLRCVYSTPVVINLSPLIWQSIVCSSWFSFHLTLCYSSSYFFLRKGRKMSRSKEVRGNPATQQSLLFRQHKRRLSYIVNETQRRIIVTTRVEYGYLVSSNFYKTNKNDWYRNSHPLYTICTQDLNFRVILSKVKVRCRQGHIVGNGYIYLLLIYLLFMRRVGLRLWKSFYLNRSRVQRGLTKIEQIPTGNRKNFAVGLLLSGPPSGHIKVQCTRDLIKTVTWITQLLWGRETFYGCETSERIYRRCKTVVVGEFLQRRREK